MARRVGRGTALLFLDRGTRRGEWSAARPNAISSFVISGGILFKMLVLGINEMLFFLFLWCFKRLFLIFGLQEQYLLLNYSNLI